jgi:hypothetical protein
VNPGLVNIKFYPNPTDGKVYIFGSNNSITGMQLQVINTLGQQLLNMVIDSNPEVIDLSGRAGGIYYFKITGNAGIKVEKIVVR